MARSFSSRDANQLVEGFQNIQQILQRILDKKTTEQYKAEIKAAADAYITAEILEKLQKIPIEEVNREKLGIKVKALRDYGFNTIADIAPKSVYQIASVYGISQDSAYTIHRIVKEIVNQTQKNSKIRISSDNRSKTATKLIKAIDSFIQHSSLVEMTRMVNQDYSEHISRALRDIEPGTGGIRWLFSSSKKKKGSEQAFQYLTSILDGDFGNAIIDIRQQASHIQQISDYEAWEDFEKKSVRFFKILEEISPELLGNDDVIYGLPEELAREVQDEAFFPDGLLCELRRYQEWGVRYILHQERVLLGDEMGLGKTIQAIATMVSLKNTGATHFIVVCPASVITNWCREIASKSKLSVTKIHGAGRSQALKSWIHIGGVAVTTYETTAFFKLEDTFRFSMLVVDEAHYVKNPEAARTMYVKLLAQHAERLLFMTGTPLENKVSEMVLLIQMLQPLIAERVKHIQFLSAAPEFRHSIAPVYYRRKREDVLTELPELIENLEWCTLLPEEKAVYEAAVLRKDYAESRRVSWSVDELKNSSKARRMLEIIEEAESDGRKIIVFSFFLDTIRKIVDLMEDRCLNPINGSVSPARRQEIIDEFEKAPAGTVLAAQIQSGGTGLNIQTASVVILCEPQFKPSIENQAISRAYRMGQTRNVLVYRLLCENTVDEKIINLLKEKQELFDAFADKSEAAQNTIELDEKTFGDIIKSEINRINAEKGVA